MQEMQIYGVSFDLVGKQPIVLLKTAEGNKFLPIWIGHPEAAAILMKLQSASTPRPMTHDLVTDMLDQLGAQVTRITVTELRENTFYARITVQQDGTEIEVDSRPSDAIALAVRADAPIFAADAVIEESAIEFECFFSSRRRHTRFDCDQTCALPISPADTPAGRDRSWLVRAVRTVAADMRTTRCSCGDHPDRQDFERSSPKVEPRRQAPARPSLHA